MLNRSRNSLFKLCSCVVTPYNDVVGYQRLGKTYCLFLQGEPEDGGGKVYSNVGIPPHQYTASRPRRPWLEPCIAVKNFKSRKFFIVRETLRAVAVFTEILCEPWNKESDCVLRYLKTLFQLRKLCIVE